MELKPQIMPPPMEMKNPDVETRESTVNINGIQYQLIEYEGRQFYFRFLNSEDTLKEEEVLCNSPQSVAPPERLVHAAVKITKRKRLFIEGLYKQCNASPEYGNHINLIPSPILGIAVGTPSSDGGEKKVYIDPINRGGGFKADF